MAATWLEEIVSAFQALGGVVSYDQLYKYIEANTSRQLTKAWKATVRREVENHSTDSENYRGGEDLFYPVHGIHSRSGMWGLKSMRSTAPQQATGQTIGDYTTTVDKTDKKSISEHIADYVPQAADLLDIDDIDKILNEEEEELDAVQDFNPEDIIDARERIFAAIVRRRGQSKFRSNLLRAYDGKCAITGTSAQQVLEASHILAYKGSSTNSVSNGLLLRADLHTLFDLRLLAIDTTNMTVLVSPQLQDTEYSNLAGKTINLPTIASNYPSKLALDIQRREARL